MSNYSYAQCDDCVHKDKPEPNPCQSCEQPMPTNFTEEETKWDRKLHDNLDHDQLEK